MRVVPVAPCILAAQHALQRCGFRFHDFAVVVEVESGATWHTQLWNKKKWICKVKQSETRTTLQYVYVDVF